MGACSLLAVLSPAAGAQAPARVEVAPVVAAPVVQTITLAGSLRSPQFSSLSARVEGYVISISVEAGDHVESGQVLLRLDDEIARLELRRLQAVLREAESLLSDQQRRVKEAANLIADNNFSRSEHQSLRAELAAREARLEQYRAATEIQRTRLGQHEVSAPFAGVVTAKLVEVGHQVSANTALLSVASMEPIWAEVQIPERHLRQVREGTPVRIRPGFEGSDWLPGKVTRLVPVSADSSRTFLVRSELPNPDWQLAPGMSLRMELAVGDGKEVLQVPADAVINRVTGEQLVWIVREVQGALVARALTVQLGRRGSDKVEVSAPGLTAGERVVIRGNENLQPGQAVVIVASTPPGD